MVDLFLKKHGENWKTNGKNKSVQRGSLGKTCFSLASWNAKLHSPILEKLSFFGDCTWHLIARFLTFQKPKRRPNDFLVMFSSTYNLSKSGFGAIQGFFWSGMTTRKPLRSSIFSHQKELRNPFLLFKHLPGPGRPMDFRPQPPSKMIGLGGSFTANRRDFSAWDWAHRSWWVDKTSQCLLHVFFRQLFFLGVG